MINLNTIKEMSYTDFIGFVNQWNVPPGAYDTLSRWINYGDINENSNILEIACTTGFSLREIALITGCSGEGVDISNASIKTAKDNLEKISNKLNIKYTCCDAYEYHTNNKYSHIIVGGALRFFPDPKKMLEKTLTLISNSGLILSSEFYVTKSIPDNLIKKAESIFNFTPTQIDYKNVMKIYQGLEIIYEEKKAIIPETSEEINFYCKSTIERCCKQHKIMDKSIKQALFNRLIEIKEMSNLLREYQEYSVLVMRYREEIYPNRYIELF